MAQGTSPARDDEAVVAFMQQLGIHPDEEPEFGWIAEVGLQSPLPPRWTSHADPDTGFTYYVDHDRQESEWCNPLVPYLRRIVEIGRAYLQTLKDDFFEEQKGILWHQHKHELDCWHGPFSDAEGRPYFVNSTTGISSWQDPRIDAQYIFELESGLLTSLQEVMPPPMPGTPGFGAGRGHWKTEEGADVLSLDVGQRATARSGYSSSAASSRPRSCAVLSSLARADADQEHRSMLERFGNTAELAQAVRQDEEEVQRMQINRKLEARRWRKRRSGSQSGAESMDSGSSVGSTKPRPIPEGPHDALPPPPAPNSTEDRPPAPSPEVRRTLEMQLQAAEVDALLASEGFSVGGEEEDMEAHQTAADFSSLQLGRYGP